MRTDGPAALWFKRITARIHEALPAPLRRLVPVTFIGYVFINGSAFLLDMGVLFILSHLLHHPHDAFSSTTGLLYSIGYGIASIYAFFLNRTLNFREHGDLGKQSGKYVAVIVSNYLIWILGAGTLLGMLSVPLFVGRVLVACCEGLYIYFMLRLWVFPRRRQSMAELEPSPNDPDQPAAQESPVA